MFKNFDFEAIHPSHKAAFADGALCGIVVSVIAASIYRAYKSDKRSDPWADVPSYDETQNAGTPAE